jgi:hypothetical protein
MGCSTGKGARRAGDQAKSARNPAADGDFSQCRQVFLNPVVRSALLRMAEGLPCTQKSLQASSP